MTEHVFVSYSRVDRPYVEQLVAHLQAAGIEVWYDYELTSGDRWERVIKRQIESCRAMIIVMSPASEDSVMVSNEIDLARGRDRTLHPLLLDGEVFFGLRHRQYEDVRGGRMPSKRFVDALKPPPPPPPPPKPEPAPAGAEGQRRIRARRLGGGVAFAGGSGPSSPPRSRRQHC